MKTKERAPQMMASSDRELERENKAQSWRPFFQFIRSVRFPWLLIALSAAIQLFGDTLRMMFPQYTQAIFEGNFTTGLAVTAICVLLGRTMLTAVYSFIAQYSRSLSEMRCQNFIWRRLSRLPISYYEDNEPRDLVSRTTEDVGGLCMFINLKISSTISILYTFIGSLALIVQYDWRLAVSQIISIPLCYVIGLIGGRVYFRLNNRLQARLSTLTRYLSAVLPNLALVKLFGQAQREEKAGSHWINDYADTTFKNSVASSAVLLANMAATLLQELVIIFVGLWLIREGAITVAVWVAFAQYANIINSNFSSVITIWQQLKGVQGSAARLTAATSVAPEENAGTAEAGKGRASVAFRNVSFAYDRENDVLHDVSFTAEPGQITAIVGPSGAGKSTILNLVERFYIPGEGSLALDGRDAREYELNAWRRNIGYIPQDTQLLAGTIGENIAQGVPGQVSREELEEAARKADILEYIQSLPQGFDTQVGENGAKLSGGQKQRIAIARALLMKSQILALDEATSNLDAETEYQIQQTLKTLSKDHTVIMVAHRLASVRDAEKIVVLDRGRVAAQGVHSELMAGCPLYRHMTELQSAGVSI